MSQVVNRIQNTLLVTLALYILYRASASLQLYLKRRRIKKQAGCKPLNGDGKKVGSWPFGFDHVKEGKAAYDAGNYPLFFDSCFKRFGKTWMPNGVLEQPYFTMDHRIVQVILSTQFESKCMT